MDEQSSAYEPLLPKKEVPGKPTIYRMSSFVKEALVGVGELAKGRTDIKDGAGFVEVYATDGNQDRGRLYDIG